ncbi:hypothetical protein [Acanthopleuribacter pedis]|uniref:Uncharacterized protein n=1 Tax=Acanthopleuribacter pedis TaxID=442870 RepID=A0A8J7QL96_9BACT|nr:hypothetical protein [Acanthopleuribacter pedis]MBO1323186.1 hypothetical protein [Acanthopleuribacter pedis]
MSQPPSLNLPIGNGFSRLLLLFLWCFLLACGGSGDGKQDLSTRISKVNEQIQLLEGQISATDVDTTNKLERIKEDMRGVEDLIIEEDYARASQALTNIRTRLQALKASQTDNSSTLDLQPFGKVEIKKHGAENFETMDNLVDLSKVAVIRTGVRSGLQLNPPKSQTSFFLSSQSEIKLGRYDVGNGRYRFALVKGVFQFELDKSNKATMGLGDWKAEMRQGASGELSHIPVTKSSHIALHQGTADWTEGADSGNLTKYQSLHWQDGKRSASPIPVAPNLDQPKNRHTLLAPGGSERDIPFRWHSEIYIPSFHFQLSDQPLFVTRLEDKMGVTSSDVELSLGPGVYYWRVRGISDQGVPGAFSQTFKFEVTANEGSISQADAPEGPTSDAPGPPIRNLEVEVLGGMAIISGKTDVNASVNVNGVAAVMIEAGQFSAVVNFTQRGEHRLRIIAAYKESGGETVIERKVKINF